jgi:hypothetical protein
MANLIVPDAGEGSIDRELLRDKFTGRSNLFFNVQNAGGVRSNRQALNFSPDILQLDPAVKYRAFSSQTAADDFLQTGLIAGRGHYANSLFFNQGVPLLSYAQTSVPNQRFLIATLGDNWADRNANTFGTKGRQGGLGLDIAKDSAAFAVEPPISISANPYTEQIGDLSAPDEKKFKSLKELKKYAKELELKYLGKNAGTEKGLPRPAIRADRRISDIDFTQKHLPRLAEAKKELLKIGDYLLSPDVQRAVRLIREKEISKNTELKNPLLDYYQKFFRTIDDGHLRGVQDANHGGRYPTQLPLYDEVARDIFDTSPENVKALKAQLKTSIDGFLDSTISRDWIVPFDRELTYFPDGVRDSRYPNAFGTFTEPTASELKYLKKYFKEGSTYLQHGVPQHSAGVMNNPHLNPSGIEGYALTTRTQNLADLFEETQRLFDPKRFATTFSLEDLPDRVPFPDFGTGYADDGTLAGTNILDKYGKPVVPNTPQEGLYIQSQSPIQPTLTTAEGTPLIRLTSSDEGLFKTPQGVLHNLNNVFDQTLSAWGKQTKIKDLEIPRMGLGGAMYSEVLPTTSILGNYLDPETNQPRQWQMLSPFINPQEGSRPAVMFQIMDDGTYKVVKEFNNNPTSEGWKPIPTGTLAPEKQKEAYVRYLQEMTQEVAKGRTELIGLKSDIFSEILQELPQNLTPSEVEAAIGSLTPTQLDSVATRLIAAGISPAQIIDSKRGNYDAYLPSGKNYRTLGGLVEEATRGDPNYGKKGFLDLKAYLGGFKEMVTPEINGEGMVKFFRDPKLASKFSRLYFKNPEFASYVNANMGGALVRTAGKLGEIAGIATAPMMSRERLGAYVQAYYEKTGKDPRGTYSMGKDGVDDLFGMGVLSGVENALDVATFGNYDSWTGNEVQIARKELLDRYATMEDAMKPISDWQKARERRQAGIDNPVYNGQTFTRTTK